MTPQSNDRLLTLIAQYEKLGIREQIDYEKFYLYSIITHSTAIEGSTVTEVEAQLLFDEGITSSKRTLTEQMMNLDLKDAYDFGMNWIKSHAQIAVDDLQLLASKVMAHTGAEYHSIGGDFSSAKGELRKLNVTAGYGGKSYMSYLKVPVKLQAFCEELNERRRTVDRSDIIAVYELSFWAHYELVTIHPWVDGNGRMSRLLMNLLQIEFDVIPTKVLRGDKSAYIQSLVDTREQEDLDIFVRCMTDIHCKHLAEEMAAFIASVGENADKKGGQKRWTEKVDRKGGQKTRSAILSLIGNNSQITSTKMAEAIGINRSAISKHLKKMQDEGIIRHVGPANGGHWTIIRHE